MTHLVDREPGTLSLSAIKELQDELRRYRDFWLASKRHSVTLTIDDYEATLPDHEERLRYRKERAAMDLGLAIAADRDWVNLPAERYHTWGAAIHELTVTVWPENFYRPKGDA